MGWDKLAVELGKVEDAITTFVATVRKQNNGGSNVQAPNNTSSSDSTTVVK
jgi:hypothetical protein